MSRDNIFNSPPSDAFEDNFYAQLGKFKRFTDKEIRDACVFSHSIIGGESGDEPFEYAKMLVREDKEINKIGIFYEWNN